MVANMDNVRTFMQNLEVTTEDRTFDVANKETFFTILRPSMIWREWRDDSCKTTYPSTNRGGHQRQQVGSPTVKAIDIKVAWMVSKKKWSR